ncbi:cupin domain-containing protein [Streptosporangium sp. NBC_01755]|uniref:cupin domain-containing protein n=1 Tax=unclassified Streptosporangium TaxID=2632669 RepID=UPI002DDA9860|nr:MULTISPECIES: cupin domain-containing protein [unclassified Streptosporangium]WSA23590.1 cupin domain-containing protein [Streptosporangium sp. NBC_01810]WSC98202.1 cupin domain-containing protein [Streptosporangium sp. NBC_01755]
MPEILVPEPADLTRMITAAGAFSVPTGDVQLSPDELEPDQILAGSPRVSSIELWSSPDGKQSRGIWEITPGTVGDVERDEMFVVLSGRATLEVDGGAALELVPGSVCLLAEGAKTVWIVHETLRKVYHSMG